MRAKIFLRNSLGSLTRCESAHEKSSSLAVVHLICSNYFSGSGADNVRKDEQLKDKPDVITIEVPRGDTSFLIVAGDLLRLWRSFEGANSSTRRRSNLHSS